MVMRRKSPPTTSRSKSPDLQATKLINTMNPQTSMNTEPRRISLAECAEVRIGYTPSTRQPDWEFDTFGNSGTNTAPMLQPSDIDPLGGISWDRVRRVRIDGNSGYQTHELRGDDVVLSLRGTNRAVHITFDMLQSARERTRAFGVIASSAWAVLTPHREMVQAAYLAWYFNQSPTADRLRASQVGAVMPFLKVGTLREFEITLPTIEAQAQIGSAHTLINRIQQLENQRADLCRRFLGAIVSKNVQTGTRKKYPYSGK